jgi:hypothetical protein
VVRLEPGSMPATSRANHCTEKVGGLWEKVGGLWEGGRKREGGRRERGREGVWEGGREERREGVRKTERAVGRERDRESS